MKFEINTIDKIIKLTEMCGLDELMATLNAMPPNDGWKEYKIEVCPNITYIPVANPQPVIPYNPWRVGDVWYISSSPSWTLTAQS